MPDDSADSIVTDPPYGLRFMGKKWDYDVPATDVWAECLRVLKPGGHLLAFAGTRTQHRMAVRIEDAGFEIRDMIAWVYGSGFPKSRNIAGDMDESYNAAVWQGWGTALKPALEPITVARKPLVGTVAANVLQFGTGALNIDACRVETDDDLNGGAYGNGSKDLSAATSYATGVNAGEFVQPTGRWPANLIHDGSDQVLAAFPQAPGQQGKSSDSQRTKANVYGDLSDNGKEYEPRDDSGSAARFFYCAKASRKDRNEGCEHMAEKPLLWSSGTQNPGSFQAEGTNRASQNNHPTVKPTDLMAYLCRLVTPPGGVVLDPYMGSGSTGKAAIREGFRFIGIELDAAYISIARARINSARTRI
jgi:site-specific DNA-methyltransferase (adenine-specific)